MHEEVSLHTRMYIYEIKIFEGKETYINTLDTAGSKLTPSFI
jgi:hypothetical protein